MDVQVRPFDQAKTTYSQEHENMFRRDLETYLLKFANELRGVSSGSSAEASLASKRELFMSLPVGVGGAGWFEFTYDAGTDTLTVENIVCETLSSGTKIFTPGTDELFLEIPGKQIASETKLVIKDDKPTTPNTYLEIDTARNESDDRWVRSNVNFEVVGRTIESTVTTLPDTATPIVSDGNLFRTSGPTNITDFLSGKEGQTITILADDTVVVEKSANMLLGGAVFANYTMNTRDTLTLTRFGSKWYEISRSNNDG